MKYYRMVNTRSGMRFEIYRLLYRTGLGMLHVKRQGAGYSETLHPSQLMTRAQFLAR